MSEPRFVITGTGRSGTMHTARLLTAAGLRCGHEEYFRGNPSLFERGPRRRGVGKLRTPVGRAREWWRRRPLRLDGDASWMAVPRLESFGGVRVLQLRHPMAVVRSFTGTRFFSEPERYGSQAEYARAFFDPSGDDVLDAMRWWVLWNSWAAAHADLVVRLEDLGVETVAEILERLDEPDSQARAQAALESTTPGANSSRTRGASPDALGPDDLPTGKDLDALDAAARRFGYSLRD